MSTKKPFIAINSNVGRDGSVYLNEDYVLAIEKCGGIPIVIPVGASKDSILHAMANCHGLMLIGGPDVPPELYGMKYHVKTKAASMEKAIQDLWMTKLADKLNMPIFGICAGMQMIAVSRSGKLIQDIGSQVETKLDHDTVNGRHRIFLIGKNTKIKKAMCIERSLMVNSRHHQAIIVPGENMITSAVAVDGITEAIEDSNLNKWVVGVQWHPENLVDQKHHKSLMENFIGVADRRAMLGESRNQPASMN